MQPECAAQHAKNAGMRHQQRQAMCVDLRAAAQHALGKLLRRFTAGRRDGVKRGQAAIAGILANPAFTTVLPTTVTPEEAREYAAARTVF